MAIKYTEIDLQKAIDAVQSGGFSLRQAQKEFKVPKSTLSTKIGTNIGEKRRPGPSSVLTKEEESSIATWALQCSERGQPRTPLDIRFAAQTILKKFPRAQTFKNDLPSKKWYNCFMKRNPVLKVRKPEPLSSASANVAVQDLRGWWKTIDNYLENQQLKHVLNDPSRIANCDETLFEFNVKPGKVIVEKQSKNSYLAQKSGNKTGITVMHTVST